MLIYRTRLISHFSNHLNNINIFTHLKVKNVTKICTPCPVPLMNFTKLLSFKEGLDKGLYGSSFIHFFLLIIEHFK